MADIRRIPFTEQVERLQKDLVRDNSTAESKYQARINDAYTTVIPSMIDWRHIKQTGTITTTADYSTGYCSAISTTAVTGDSTVWTSANSNNLVLKVDGYDELYRVTYGGATSLTLDRSWIGDAVTSNTTYLLFQDRYALASDFDRMILESDKCVYYWDNGKRIYLDFVEQESFKEKQTYTTNTPTQYTIMWVGTSPYLYIDAPDTDSRTLYYDYIPILKRLSEYTTGTITTLANGGTAVTGSGTAFDGFVTDTTNYEYYFRIDADGTGAASEWYKISTAGSGTSLTLSDAYGGTAISSGTSTYTISMLSKLPPGIDLAIIYEAAIVSAADQNNDLQFKAWTYSANSILSNYKAVEGKLDYSKQRVRTVYERSGVRR